MGGAVARLAGAQADITDYLQRSFPQLDPEVRRLRSEEDLNLHPNIEMCTALHLLADTSSRGPCLGSLYDGKYKRGSSANS